MKTITVENRHLEVLFQALKGTEGILPLAGSRVRDSFLKLVGPVLDTFYENRKKIYEKFCLKNEDGTPDIKNDLFHFPKESVPEMNEELELLLSETVDFDLPFPEIVKNAIQDTEYKPKTGEAEMIDELVAKI